MRCVLTAKSCRFAKESDRPLREIRWPFPWMRDCQQSYPGIGMPTVKVHYGKTGEVHVPMACGARQTVGRALKNH
jgi:hypothetical protein